MNGAARAQCALQLVAAVVMTFGIARIAIFVAIAATGIIFLPLLLGLLPAGSVFREIRFDHIPAVTPAISWCA